VKSNIYDLVSWINFSNDVDELDEAIIMPIMERKHHNSDILYYLSDKSFTGPITVISFSFVIFMICY